MRSIRRILSVVLCAALLCALAVPALADNTYLIFRSLMISEEAGFGLGTPVVTPHDEAEENLVMLCYDTEMDAVALMGHNESEAGEICGWQNVGAAKGVGIVYALCANWSAMAEIVPESTMLVLGIGKGEDYMWINTAEGAAAFAQLMEGSLTGETAEETPEAAE